MRIDQWMKHPVHTVKPRASIRQARGLMERHRINQLPVVVDGRLVGIVTDRDLRDAFPSVFEPPRHGDTKSGTPEPEDVPVDSVMTANTLSLGPKDLVVDAARLMRRERIGAIPIVDDGRLVGILARSDVLDAFVELAGQPAAVTG
jgi:acetoin utilization protein AcuB